MIAFLTEFIDLLFRARGSWGLNFRGLLFVEISTLLTINTLTFLCLAAFSIRVLKEHP